MRALGDVVRQLHDISAQSFDVVGHTPNLVFDVPGVGNVTLEHCLLLMMMPVNLSVEPREFPQRLGMPPRNRSAYETHRRAGRLRLRIN